MPFNRNSGGNREGGFRQGRRPRFNDRGPSRGPIEMHKAICDNCGKECEVPFRPTSGKPIYCNECFGKQRGGSDSSPALQDKIAELNTKLDKILGLLSSVVASEEVTAEVVEKPAKVAQQRRN